MSISYPNKNSIGTEHRVLIVSLGGAAASSDPTDDKISTIAKDIAEAWNPGHLSSKILSVTGGTSPFYSSRKITEEIIEICEQMRAKSQKFPGLILIGKSMGGCKLHKVANRLAEEDVDIDLLISVDMSCHLARHYDKYRDHHIDEKVFPNNVRSLVNFFQAKKDEAQWGHIAIWNAPGPCQHTGPFAMYKDFNINVNEDCIRIGADGEILFEGDQKICQSVVGHLEIDNDPRLLSAINEIVEKRVLRKIN